RSSLMPIAFYMDHHIPRAITVGLRLRGVDVITAYEDASHELAARHFWTVPPHWNGYCSHAMIICWPKQRDDSEQKSPFGVSFTPINSRCR
ncbi:MAG: hypothetical protein V3R80_07875, partial [Candidatus Tectomicrobia bacterium]